MQRLLMMAARILAPLILTRLMRRKKKQRPVPGAQNVPPQTETYDGQMREETVEQHP